ncbi:MAG: DUF4249 domain-containing protein [Muribaculaceae bacterium]|nr:DUF4249 domain-containing protein [Muribaculaceae bacterium]
MAILKKTYIILLLTAMAVSLNSCYTEFDPHIDSTPVLCMNSIITPGDSIALFLTRTWSWTEGDEDKIDLNVRDAEVRMIVNGQFKETLTHRVIDNPDYFFGPYHKRRECYVGEYRPESGDIIRLEAISPRYGNASAEVTVPYPVPIDRIEAQVQNCIAYGDTTGFPTVANECRFDLNFKLLAYFTDPSESTDYYDLRAGYSPAYGNFDEDAYGQPGYRYPSIDFSGEPLLTEHVSVLESVTGDTYGYTVFSDRQINGVTYPLRITVNNYTFYYRNPIDLPGPKETGITVQLCHIDQPYYKHVISVWEGNDGITGALGGVGLASPVYPWSNVSTGAGVVATYAKSEMTIPIVHIIELAQQGIFQ